MIDLSPVSHSVAGAAAAVGVPASAPKANAGASSGSFGQTLGAFLDSRDAGRDPAPATLSAADRQDPAVDGKALPAITQDDTDSTPPLPWIATLVVPPIVVPVAVAAPPVAATAGVTVAGPGAQPIAPPKPTATATVPAADARPPAADAPVSAIRAPALADPASIAALDSALARATATPKADTANTAEPADAAVALAHATAAPAIVVGAAPQPAARAFAAALATAWRDRSPHGDDQDAGTTAAPTLGLATPLQGRDHGVVQATGAAGQSALDLTHDTGLQRMIDHIETLRDGADARDTRIRLVPDALGGVDVAVRQQGDRIHVHFTADHEATRALLAEAQPRLSELAAARGVRIGDTSVSVDPGSGNDAAPQQRPAPPVAAAPRAPSAEAETETPTDLRVA